MVTVRNTNESSASRQFYDEEIMGDAYDQSSAPEWRSTDDGYREAKMQRDVADRLVEEYDGFEIVDDEPVEESAASDDEDVAEVDAVDDDVAADEAPTTGTTEDERPADADDADDA